MKRVAVGFFDGVHLGHQAIVRRADAVLTFRNHPRSVLSPTKAPRLIMTAEQRLAALGKPTTMLDFTPDLAALSPETFAARYLSDAAVVCGENWRFGAQGCGDAAWLRTHGWSVEVVPYATYEGAPISSTRIRKALEDGDLLHANAMLSRPFATRGVPFAGKGLGRSLGFPTVNFTLPDVTLGLMKGVYAVEIGGVRGVANYGLAPTLGAQSWKHPVLEVHFRTTGEAASVVPGHARDIAFHRFIRPEKAFLSLDELKCQIQRDCESVFAVAPCIVPLKMI